MPFSLRWCLKVKVLNTELEYFKAKANNTMLLKFLERVLYISDIDMCRAGRSRIRTLSIEAGSRCSLYT